MQVSRFAFGPFVLDPGAGTLLRNDVPVAVGYRVLKLHSRHWGFRIAYLLVLLVPLVLATNFLAGQNKMLNDAIRDDGGLKRTKTR